MSDYLFTVNTGQQKRLKDMGDGSVAEVIYIANPGGGGGGGGASPYTITQTVVAVGTTTTQVIAANASRKYLAWMVVGTADVTVSAGPAAAVVGAGLIYQAAGVANKQGASESFQGNAPINAFQCIAAATGSNLIVWEGV